MLTALSRPYVGRYGSPTLRTVDDDIFRLSYFHDCMGCTFCHDSCCQYGTAVDLPKLERIMQAADVLEPYIGVPREQWFHDEVRPFPDFPGGEFRRTRVVDGRCVFLNRAGRGCLIHKYSLEQGLDVHDLKPMVCMLFPLDFEEETLFPAVEVVDRSLICVGNGLTCYRSARNDVLYYFGAELVAELDALEAVTLRDLPKEAKTVPLPVVE
jgi:Fe-S-cluster containining protein